MTPRYVALGSSMAAGPGIAPGAPGAPKRSGRSAVNYPHLVADRLGYDLVDVTFSGATTTHLLTERQYGAPPQVDALDGSESLVTITIGGNDAGYVPMLGAACLPRFLRSVPVVGGRLRGLLVVRAAQRLVLRGALRITELDDLHALVQQDGQWLKLVRHLRRRLRLAQHERRIEPLAHQRARRVRRHGVESP